MPSLVPVAVLLDFFRKSSTENDRSRSNNAETLLLRKTVEIPVTEIPDRTFTITSVQIVNKKCYRTQNQD
jgi:hypothetical protein